MTANRLYLVCKHCQRQEDAFCVGSRAGNDVPYEAGALRKMDEWYAKHFACGNGCDHITFGMWKPADWDRAEDATHSVAGEVRMALINGSTPTEGSA